MDHDFGPFPDYDSALKWLEERGSFIKGSFTPKEVARRVLAERIKDSIIVRVRGFDYNLPDSDIHKAMANHFSCCGEIVRVQLCPMWVPKSHPDRFVRINIIGEDVKEKAEQLNGSELGGCKLVVHVPPPNLGVSMDFTMDSDFGPFPDYDSALKWLEERGSFDKDSWIAKTLTPKEVARRVFVQRIKDSKVVCVRGFDNNLPDFDIEMAIANHFSCCGEIVQAKLSAPKSAPDRFVRLNIIGEDVKEKAEQLNGSDLGGCKLAVLFQPADAGIVAAHFPRFELRRLKIIAAAHSPRWELRHKITEHESRLNDSRAEARKALHEKERKQEEEAGLEEKRKQPAQNRMAVL